MDSESAIKNEIFIVKDCIGIFSENFINTKFNSANSRVNFINTIIQINYCEIMKVMLL